MDTILHFNFKGQRNYVHGTDIYTKVLEYLGTNSFRANQIDMSFHKIIHRNLKLQIERFNNSSFFLGESIAVIKFQDLDNGPMIIKLSESRSEITGRYNYEEEQITDIALYDLENKSVSLSVETAYNNIEKVVALNKGLLSKIFTDLGKWYFTRLTINEDINQLTPRMITLQLIKNIGSKITKTSILFDNVELGHIYFSKIAI